MGTALPSQRLSTGELAVLVENVPPFSGQAADRQAGKGERSGNLQSVRREHWQIPISALSIDPKRGAVESLTWGEKKIELVDRTKGPGLNQYLYVPGKDARDARELAGVKVRVKENGNLVASLLVEANAPGCRRYAAEYRVVDGIARVDIINRIDKASGARKRKRSTSPFPSCFPAGSCATMWPTASCAPSRTSWPGSCKNFFSIQSWVDVSNSERGVTWASADAPLIEIGAITAEQPWAQTTQSSPCSIPM